MKNWKRLKREIAIILAGVTLLSPISAVAEDIFTNKDSEPVTKTAIESGGTAMTADTTTIDEQAVDEQVTPEEEKTGTDDGQGAGVDSEQMLGEITESGSTTEDNAPFEHEDVDSDTGLSVPIEEEGAEEDKKQPEENGAETEDKGQTEKNSAETEDEGQTKENSAETEDVKNSEEQDVDESVVSSDGSLAGQILKFVNLYWETENLGDVEVVFDGGEDERIVQPLTEKERGIYETSIPKGDYSRISFRVVGSEKPLEQSTYNYYGIDTLDEETDTCSFVPEKNNTFYYDMGENPSYWGADPEYEVTDPQAPVSVIKEQIQPMMMNAVSEEDITVTAPETEEMTPVSGNPQPGQLVYLLDMDAVEAYAKDETSSPYQIEIAFMKYGHTDITDLDDLPEGEGKIYTMYEKSPGVYSAPFPEGTEPAEGSEGYSEIGFKLFEKGEDKSESLHRHYNFRGQQPDGVHEDPSKFGYFQYQSGYTDTFFMNSEQDDSYWGAHPSNADQSLDTQVLYIDTTDYTENNVVADIENMWISWNGMPQGEGDNYSSEKGYKITKTLPHENVRYFQFPTNSGATENTILTLHYEVKQDDENEDVNEEDLNKGELTYKFVYVPRSERNCVNMDYIWVFNGQMWKHFRAGEGLETRSIFYDNLKTKYTEVWMRVMDEDGTEVDKTIVRSDWGWTEEKIKTYVYEVKDKDGKVTSTWLKMDEVAQPEVYEKEKLFQLDIPGKYTQIQFRGVLKSGDKETVYYSGKEEVSEEVSYPCYYAYQSGKASDKVPENDAETPGITGYWASVYSVNTVGDESNDIPTGEIQWEEGVYYADSNFYDYYSDWEMTTGRKITEWNETDDNIWKIQAKNINTALDGYYKEAVKETGGNVDTSQLRAFYLSGDSYKADLYKNLLTGDPLWNTDIDRQNQWTGSNLIDEAKRHDPCREIVGNTLSDNGNMVLTEKINEGNKDVMRATKVEHPLFDDNFLRGDNNLDTAVGNVYNNVKFPIKADTEEGSDTYGYWVYDSAKESDAFRLTYDVDEGYFLKRTGEGIPMRNGLNSFLPFNDMDDFNALQQPTKPNNITGEKSKINYMFGLKMEFPFGMTEDGYVYRDKDGDGKFEENTEDPKKNEKLPITFEFQGDDDVWIFIDGILVLDLGGIHDALRGKIDLTNGKWEVYKNLKKDLGHGNLSYDGKGTLCGNGDLPAEVVELLADKSKSHKITMFYMERGLWESDLKLTFNFPRENRFIVEKEVDVTSTRTEGDDIFAGLLENMGSFNFNIQNQATSGDSLAIENSSGHREPGANTPLFSAGNTEATFDFASEEAGQVESDTDGIRRVAQKAQVEGGTPEENTLLKVKPSSGTLDVADKDYLRLSMKNLGATDRNANNLYLSFVDKEGKRVGGYAGALGYNGESNTFLYDEDSIIRVNFKEMTGDAGFDWSQVAYMLIGIRRIEPDDIAAYEISYASFFEKMEERPHEGFYVDDTQISDYGSVASGKLEPVDGAWYIRQTKNADGSYDSGTSWNTSGGTFNLADDQRAIFTDRFRTGSYIALNENPEPKIFDTEWTLKEGYQEIPAKYLLNSRHDIATVENPLTVISKEWPLSQVEGAVVGDGRKEIVDPSWSEKNPEFQSPTEGNTLVYRSYQDPDSSANIGTNLCVTVTNTLKRGSLTIKKQLTEESANGNGEYKPAEFTFRIYYTDIAGRGLEKQLDPLEEENRYLLQTVTVKTDKTGKGEITIPNIPAGTRYHIVEVPANGTRLEGIEIAPPADTEPHENVKKYDKNGEIVDGGTADYATAYVQGTAYASNQTVTFTNQIVPFYMDIQKIWMDNLTDEERGIEKVHIQLQRRIQGSEGEWENVTENYFGETLGDLGKGDYIVLTEEKGWKTTSKEALPVVDDVSGERYEYQIVEMNHENIFRKYEVTYDYVRGEDVQIGDEKFLHITYQAINTPAQLQLKKIWENPEDEDIYSRIRVKLLASENKDGKPEDWVCYKKLTNKYHQCGNSCYIELSSTDDWSVSMRNLPIQKDEGTLYYYKLGKEEILTDDGWKAAADEASGFEVTYGDPVTIKESSEGEDIPTVTVTNETKLGSIQIIKKDEEQKLLKGAEFKIERLKKNEDESDKTKWSIDETWKPKSETTNEQGKILFQALEYGTYRITEIKAPSGHLLNPEGIIITIPEGDMVTDMDEDEVKVEAIGKDKHHIVLTIQNSKLYELPSTGGSGIYWYTISGILLMIAAEFILYNSKNKKRKGRRS